MSRSTFAPLLARAAGACLLLALAACDKSGVHDLGRANDTLSTCGSRTSTWLRSLDEETELFVLGSTRPGTGSSSGCFVRALVNQDSSVAMETGTYSVDGGGAGSTSITATYRFLFQPDRGPLQREGAVRFDQDPPITQDLRIGMDAAQLTIDVDGEARHLTALPEVIRRLQPDTQAGAEDIFRLVNIMFYMSQTRVQGFGATGMTMYITPSDFNGIVSGTYRVAVQGGLRIGADLTYFALRDLTDIQMDGNQHTMIDLGGNGPTSEMITFTLDHPDRSTPITYTIFYDELIVVNGAAGDGQYVVDSDGDMFTLDWPIAQDVHLRNVLPVGE
ncbi:MAG: hypothetical protein H6726_12480 [Sandaracinaceae bacterium]|nr:hypothetical protein [Myxococcales bacterium]MCB9658457.1 hypothetical protein [Sandaracinaceae bacterium]